MKNKLLLVITILLSSCNFDESVNLNTDFAKDQTSIYVTNNDSFIYRDCVVMINYEYQYSFEQLSPGVKFSIPFSKFSNANNTRFNIYTSVIKDVSIFCKLDEGKKGVASGSFQ